MRLNGAGILVEKVLENGVDTVFGYPGGAVLPIYDELYKNSDRLKHIITAHEQGASFAAEGYARVSGFPGVLIATSGPGATNVVTGIANAHMDSIPMVVVTGNVPQSVSGKDSFQEVDIVSITSSIVKHSYAVKCVEDLPSILDEAFEIASFGRKGPVLIDIPKDVQVAEIEYVPVNNEKEKTLYERVYDSTNIDRVLEAIKNSKRPFIYSGGGVISSGAEESLKKFAELIDAPVGLSLMGITALDSDFKLNLGMCGMHGKYASTTAQDRCDLMIALGVRFSDRATGDLDIYSRNKVIVHVDIDHAEIEKNVSSKINVVGDLKSVLDRLISELEQMDHSEWLEEVETFKEKEPYQSELELNPMTILQTVGNMTSDDTVVTTDVGQHQMWTTLYYKFKKSRTLLTSGGLGAMGYGFGAAIGASIAKGGKETVLITGDGSFAMNLNEFSTAVSQRLPIVIVVMNNNALGMVKQWQNMFFGMRYSHTVINRQTDFVKVAEAFGASGKRVFTVDELKDAMKNRKSDGPFLIDCMISEDIKVFPMVPPGGSAKTLILEEA